MPNQYTNRNGSTSSSTSPTNSTAPRGNGGAPQSSAVPVVVPSQGAGTTPVTPYTPVMMPGQAISTIAGYNHHIMQGQPMQGTAAANAYGPAPTPQPPAFPTQGNPWPNAMYSGILRRTHAHLTAHELATDPHRAAASAAIEQLLALQGGGVVADANGTVTYVASQNMHTPQPLYAQGFGQNAGSAAAVPHHPGGGVAQSDGPNHLAERFAAAAVRVAQIMLMPQPATAEQAAQRDMALQQVVERADAAIYVFVRQLRAVMATAAPADPYLGEDAIFHYEDEDHGPQAGPSHGHGRDMDRNMWRGPRGE